MNKISIFGKDGKLEPLTDYMMLPERASKICVRHLKLAHYVNDHPGIPDDAKAHIISELDGAYFSGKRMNAKLCEYKFGEKHD